MDLSPEALSPNELDAAYSRLAALEAASAAEDQAAPSPKSKSQGSSGSAPTTAADRAAANAAGQGTNNQTDKGTPSAAESGDQSLVTSAATKDQTADPAKTGKPQQQQDPQSAIRNPQSAIAKGSKYAQDHERRDNSWKALNAEKAAFAAERKKLEGELGQQRAALEAEREQFAQERQGSRVTPEQYEAWAANEKAKADRCLAEAQKAEDNADFDKAEKLRAAAARAKGYEDLAREQADAVRRNPPATDAQAQAKREAQQKEWTLKAATDFPELAKKDSAVQQETAAFLRYVGQNFPHLAKTPQLIYLATERAQYKTAADRVPGLEKELDTAKKKVAELEALTNPTPAPGAQQLPAAKSFSEMTPEEQFAALRAEAAGMV